MRIEDLTLDELHDLNELICKRIDYLRLQNDINVLTLLRLGQKVHFNAPEGQVFGVVIKINKKSVLVVSEDNRQWKIPPGLVRVMKEV
ncbi:transposase [Rheinheimera baltica]|uniref:Transposase n=1 Tax=Rheinheimera baltica TaxID=67576 RepID=A0ABT9I509_9GAMM|nr:transposase [Rheinheimera baltica]MDP5138090.1 transposase [Rheinheimera baltica]